MTNLPRRADPLTAIADGGDRRIIQLWIDGRPETTQRAYLRDVLALRAAVDKRLGDITLEDLQRWRAGLEGSPAYRDRRISAVKSLYRFAHQIGALRYNVAAALRGVRVERALGERILSEDEVRLLWLLERKPRDRAVLRCLYLTGARVSEVARSCAEDLREHRDGGVLRLAGKGGRERYVRVPAKLLEEIRALGSSTAGAPLFRSRRGKPLSASQIWRIVHRAGKRAGLEADVSPHWLRHAHASHALDRGCPIHVVQSTLGHASVATTGVYLHARPTESSALYLAG